MTVDYSTAAVAENHISYKTKAVAERHALEYARLNNVVGDLAHVALGEPFEVGLWNGSQTIQGWLVYDVSATDEGWTISSYRWYSKPQEA